MKHRTDMSGVERQQERCKRMQKSIRSQARRLQVQARLPESVELDDLVQAGFVGLIEAERRYDNSQGASFDTYASRRVQGAMLDELRARDWLPRSVRRQARVVERINGVLEQRYGRPSRERDIAAVMEVPLTRYHRHVADISNGQLLEFQEQVQDEVDEAGEQYLHPEPCLLAEERRRLLQKAIDALGDDRERTALRLYHLNGVSLRDIGAQLDLSESRVCQLHRRALVQLRQWFRDHHPEMLESASGFQAIQQDSQGHTAMLGK